MSTEDTADVSSQSVSQKLARNVEPKSNTRALYIIIAVLFLLLAAVSGLLMYMYLDDENDVQGSDDQENAVEIDNSDEAEESDENPVSASDTIPAEDTNSGSDEVEKTIVVYMFDEDKYALPDNSDYLTAVERSTTRTDVATFAVEEIIKGPLASEITSGLAPTFGQDEFIWFTSESTCSGKDFSISIVNKLATVQFCRDTMMAGDMSGWVVGQQIAETVKQFSTVDHVVVLNHAGQCLDDMSGIDAGDCEY